MQALDKDLRNLLEKTVKAGRTVAEAAAEAALGQLGVGSDRPETYLGEDDKVLRRALRIHGKQLGDVRDSKGTNPVYGVQELRNLTQEVAYQHWHRMLFARFLAENGLLMFDGVAVTLEECDELAADPDTKPAAKSGWELAGKLAARMLPQVFKPGSPVFQLTLAPEHQGQLERLVKALPEAVFLASDSLGWVYQFWQADQKERINKSEVKIGADELPAVTQLFTEPYMVSFLLHNSLGAWWATRHPDKPCPVDLEYFRTLEDGTPAAGKFEGWPDSLADFTLLDPCCGSGHFLVAAFLMLVPMRMAAEGLSAKEAVDRVLAENIHGLELDPRCVEIAVFAVALEAWRYPDDSGKTLGVRAIPAPNIACCGLKVAARVEDWQALVPDDTPKAAYLREGLARLHELFAQAPLLGSLLDPSRHEGDLFTANYLELSELLKAALGRESAGKANEGEERWDSALSALGLLDAARLLDARYQVIVTNPPFLGLERQDSRLEEYVKKNFPLTKRELALCMFERIQSLLARNGTAMLVLPGEWTFVRSHRKFRENLLNTSNIQLMVRLGSNSFISGIRATPVLMISTLGHSRARTALLDVSNIAISEKPFELMRLRIETIFQKEWEEQVDCRFLANLVLENDDETVEISEFCDARNGMSAGDGVRFEAVFWEVNSFGKVWDYLQSSAGKTQLFLGRDKIIRWELEEGEIAKLAESVKHLNHAAQNWRRGKPLWGKWGVVVNQIGAITTAYGGEKYDGSCFAIVPNDKDDVAALIAYSQSGSLKKDLKKINPTWNLKSPKTLLQLRVNLESWRAKADELYPNGLPKPYSDDPTQWLFHGHPQPATDPLQVAIARLVGYTWPAESDATMELSEEAHVWIARSKTLAGHADKDGVVCIPPVGQEASAGDRLLNLLADAYGADWNNDVLAQLLTAADHADKSLETWLRDKFFAQHNKLFHNRPFVWHIWDGLSDGFAALVNYHKLDYKALETLIYTYLGDWITRQKRDVEGQVDGARGKLAAAEVLKKRLESILAGEAPCDIFVRWKPLDQQPIGWNPDLNDGVRLNIRPFLSVDDIGKRGAGVLREKPNIKWDKDRGKDVESAPWYTLGLQYDGKEGDRINDHHLTLAEKAAGRSQKGAL